MDEKTDYSLIRLTPTKAIRAKCIDCCCGQVAEIRRCSIKACALWRYRMGREQRDNLYTRNIKTENSEQDDDFTEEEE